jgi:hypothetical protein
MLDRMAGRRYIDDPGARPAWWTPYPLPPEMAALKPVPDSRFFSSDASGRIQGGLFALDGVHPTTAAYGLVAQEFVNIMQLAGVSFPGAQPGAAARIDFAELVARDTLLSAPPKSLTPDMRLIGWLDQTIDVIKRAIP